jgi:hypothetical protein
MAESEAAGQPPAVWSLGVPRGDVPLGSGKSGGIATDSSQSAPADPSNVVYRVGKPEQEAQELPGMLRGVPPSQNARDTARILAATNSFDRTLRKGFRQFAAKFRVDRSAPAVAKA